MSGWQFLETSWNTPEPNPPRNGLNSTDGICHSNCHTASHWPPWAKALSAVLLSGRSGLRTCLEVDRQRFSSKNGIFKGKMARKPSINHQIDSKMCPWIKILSKLSSKQWLALLWPDPSLLLLKDLQGDLPLHLLLKEFPTEATETQKMRTLSSLRPMVSVQNKQKNAASKNHCLQPFRLEIHWNSIHQITKQQSIGLLETGTHHRTAGEHVRFPSMWMLVWYEWERNTTFHSMATCDDTCVLFTLDFSCFERMIYRIYGVPILHTKSNQKLNINFVSSAVPFESKGQLHLQHPLHKVKRSRPLGSSIKKGEQCVAMNEVHLGG